jgi:hypothetical protein
VLADLLPDGRFDNRHEPDKLADAVISLARGLRVGPRRPEWAAALRGGAAVLSGGAAVVAASPKEAA